jgi:pimeloyl-ACP methyl ester carboxylesterase
VGAATQFVSAGGGPRIAYDVSGQGPALMLLHGAGKSRKDWHKAGYVRRLQGDWSVIAVDIRGSGESETLTAISDFGIDAVCADLHAVADACGAGEFAVWGYSFGAIVARYLPAWSGRANALALVGAPFGPAVDDSFDRFVDDFVAKWDPLVQAYHDGRLPEKQRRSAIKGRIPMYVACFQAMRQWPVVDAGDVGCPTLLLSGSRNKGLMAYLRKNQASLDAASVAVEVVDGLTHQQEFSQIEKVFPLVDRFLRGTSHPG